MIPILTDFLLNCDESKQVAILCSLDWLNHFIDFFREDFLVRGSGTYCIHSNGLYPRYAVIPYTETEHAMFSPSCIEDVH